MEPQSKIMTWSGWIVAGLVGMMLIFSAVMKLSQSQMVVEGMVGQMDFPKGAIVVIGIVELACVIVYLIPPTAVLGAILLTGYFGGAVVAHVRIADNFLGPVIFGVLAWLSLYLRDSRIRELLPFSRPRQPKSPAV